MYNVEAGSESERFPCSEVQKQSIAIMFNKIQILTKMKLHFLQDSSSRCHLYLYLYIYKRKFARLSLTLSVTLITRLQLPTSALQPSNTINLLSVNMKFITSSSRGVQFALCSRLKKTLSNIPLKPQRHLWPSW